VLTLFLCSQDKEKISARELTPGVCESILRGIGHDLHITLASKMQRLIMTWKKNRDKTEFTLFRRCYFLNDTQIVTDHEFIQMGCLSAMLLSKTGVSDGLIYVSLCDLFKCCLRPPLAEPGVSIFLQSAGALHSHCNSSHWHNTGTTTYLPPRKPKGQWGCTQGLGKQQTLLKYVVKNVKKSH
jgi:hypothetical protein